MRSEQFRRNLLCGAGLAALGAAGLLAATPAAAQSAVVDAGVPTVSFTSPPQAGAFVGQTFLAPATTEWLNKFEFDAFKGTATLVIQGWNGSAPTGPVLFSQALNNASFQPAAVFTNGLQLVSGQSYVVYVDVTGEVREGGAPDSYAGGEFVENYSGSWSSVVGGGYDWVFSAAFSSAGGACGATPLNDAANTCAVDSTLAAGAGADGLGGTDTLQLGGSVDFSFDAGRVGTDFVNFEGLEKTGANTVTLTGTDTALTPITIDDGVLVGTTDSIKGNVTLEGVAGVTTGPVLAFDQSTNGTYAGTIDGIGVLAKAGTGELTLTGTNTFDGVISIVGGKLIGDVDAINTNVSVGAGAAVVFDQATNASYDGNINGGGALEKRGAGTLTLTGNSNYDGGTLISGGRLVGDTDALQGAITDNAQLEFAMNANGTFQGTGGAGTFGSISGSGSVIKSGTGTLTIGAANTYSGGTSISGGKVQLDHLDGLGTGTVNMDGGSLRFGANGTLDNGVSFNTAGGVVSAAAGKTVTIQGNIGVGNGDAMTFGSATDTGVIILDSVGASVWSTSTVTVAGGTLRGTGSDLSFFTGTAASTTVAAGATLDFSTSTNATVLNLQGAGTVAAGANQLRLGSGAFDGVLAGTGGLLKYGPGDLRLSGTNTLTGATTISGGKLTVADGAALSDSSAVTVTSGTLDVEDSETIGSLAGAGAVTLQSGAVLTTGGDNTSTTLSGAITGLGGLTKTGTGVFTLTGTNTYSGGTTVLAGTLQGTTSGLQGDITNNAVVDFSQATNGTYAGDMTGTGSLTKSGSGMVWLTGDVDLDGGVDIEDGVLVSVDNALKSTDVTNNHGLAFVNNVAGTFAGDITGTGSLNKLGAGRLVLSGDNTYSGGTVVGAGTLAGAVGALQGDISVLADAAVEFAQGSNATYGGDLSGGGVLVKSGAGKLTLTGSSTLSGITVAGGILQGTAANLVGNIDNDAQVIFAQGSTGTYAGDMSGTGSLVKTGNGALTLSGTNSYTGGTTISGGSLIGTTDAIQGDVVNNAQLVFDQGVDGAFAGDLSGSGDVTFQGGVTFELTGTNTSTGDMTIDGSTVLADTDAIAGDIDLANGGRLILDQDFDGSFDGDITGAGGVLTKTGNGAVRLTGTSSYTGGTNVMAGYLVGDTNSLRGSIFTYFGGYVVFDQGFDAIFDGELSGFGGFVKQGAGQLTIADAQLTDDLSYLQAGRLTVNGSIGALQVTNGTLNGTGTVGDLSMLGGVLAPGSSIGALTVNGDLLLGSASLLQIEAKPGSSDLISVTGAATLQGADVALLVQPGVYAPGTSWTIIQAGGAVSGALGDITASQSFGLMDPKFVYGAHDVKIKLVFVPEHLYGYAENDNQLEAAHGVAALPESAAVLNALVWAPTADLPHALDLLSGEMQASLASALLDDSSFAVDSTLTRLRNHDPMTPGWGVWAAARADKASLEGEPGVATLERSRDAFLTGMDYTFENGLRLGVAFGADQGDAEVADRSSKAETDGWMAEAYGRFDFGRNTLRFGAGVGGQDVSTTRTVAIGPLTEVNTGETEARTANAFVELARSYGEPGALEFEPFVGAGWAKSELDGYAETGGSSALAIGDAEVDSTYALAGLRVSREFDLGGGILKPTGSLAWENPFGEPEAAVVNSFITAPGAPFVIRGSEMDGGRALVELGVQWEAGDFKMGLTYEGAASEDFQRHGAKLYARLAF